MHPVVGVVSALPEELAPLRRRLSGRRRRPLPAAPPASLELGGLAGTPIACLVTGDGAARARAGLAAMLDALAVPAVVVVGIGGALSPELALLEIVAAREVRGPGAPDTPPDAAWRERALGLAGVRDGVVLSSAELVTDPAAKRRLGAAAPGPTVADLESAAFGSVAAARGIPYLVLRAVSDTVEERLPRLLVRCTRPDGSLDRRRVALRGLLEWWQLPALLRLRLRAGRAGRRLADVVQTLLGPSSARPARAADYRA